MLPLTSHAKGRQDGFGAGAKTSMRNAVSREGELLNSPQLLVDYLKKW